MEICKGKKTLMLDLDETLVHSQFKQVKKPDYTIPVDIEGRLCNIFVLKRPGAEYFLQQLSKHYELVIYTASLSKYAEPLMAKMDTGNWCSYRLFREHCTFVNGVFVKDLSLCGRNLKDTIIIDNSPTSYMFQPECALPILSWYDDMKDRELYEMIPLLIELSKVDDIRDVIPRFVRNNQIDYNIAFKVISATLQRQTNQEQQQQINTDQSELRLSQQPSQNTDIIEEQQHQQQSKTIRSSIQSHKEQKYHSVQPKAGINHQKLRSVDLKQPLINPWTKNQQRTADNIQVLKEQQSHKRTSSFQNEQTINNQLVSSSLPAPPVTNITNIIYNFNLTPAQQQLREQQELKNSTRRPQTSKQNLNRGDSTEIKQKGMPPESSSQLAKTKDSFRNKLNTLDVLKSELQKEELMYSDGGVERLGYTGSKSPSNKKRPQTGSVNSRIQPGYKTQKIEVGQHQMLINGTGERRSHSGINNAKQQQKGNSQTPKNQPIQGLSHTQKLPSTTQNIMMQNNALANQAKYYQKLIQANEAMQYAEGAPQTPQRIGTGQGHQRGDSQGQTRQRQIAHPSQTQQLKLNPDQVQFRPQMNNQNSSITPSSRKQPRSYSSSNNTGLLNPGISKAPNIIMLENQKYQMKNYQQHTPKQKREDSSTYNYREEAVQNQMIQQEMIRAQQKGGQLALSEKYAALLNKNLEDTSNLAKTLRNTQAHLYDKLRTSHQNATQFIQRDETMNAQNMSPKQNQTAGIKSNRIVNNLNATDKLKLDYRLTDYNNQQQSQYQGIFMNFSQTPQSQVFAPTNQNQRYSGKQASNRQSNQPSYRASINTRAGGSSGSSGPNFGVQGTSPLNGNGNPKNSKQGFEITQKFDKNELSSYQQEGRR